MKSLSIAVFALVLCGTTVWADEKVSDAEGKSIQATLTEWGCKGGEMEKESEGSGVFEIDDAECKKGQYDFKLDKEFRVISIARD